ncbi:D-alanyl-D-alanine carboxypeptidase family protein [Pelotomaculum propionicicum]|uniref:D-alanyl-D-alanine carboxypeptidase family protein n=1 Tax=Pelotomaculum propionicicum TaxID=258475 RepID=UPI003B7A6EDE
MRFKTGLWVTLTILSLLMAIFPVPASAAAPAVTGEAAVLMDFTNGQVLFEKNPEQRMYPASTTKIITAIIALESGKINDMVTIPLEASIVEGSAIGLQEGEQISLGDLIYALMLNSGNDSAIAIACHLGGSVEGFVKMMNKKAAEIGAVNTHFNNSNGLPDPDHYSTARDMALIARYAMRNAQFRDIVATKIQVIKRNDPEAQTFLGNHNKMLWNYDGAIGVKTGYTDDAGQCLVTAAVRDGRELISVVMKSEGTNIWSDSSALLDYGFTDFKTVTLAEAGKHITDIPLKFGVLENTPVVTAGAMKYNVPLTGQTEITSKAVLNENLKAPAKAGIKAGELAFYADGRELGRVDLVLRDDAVRKTTAQWWFWLLIFAAVALAVFLLLCYNDIRRRRLIIQNRRKYYYY